MSQRPLIALKTLFLGLYKAASGDNLRGRKEEEGLKNSPAWSSGKKITRSERGSLYEQLPLRRAQMWETVFGKNADFILPKESLSQQMHCQTLSILQLQDPSVYLEGESFTITHLTICWAQMEDEAGPFGTHQKTY